MDSTPKPWLISYERYGIVPSIALPTADESLLDIFEQASQRFAHHTAYIAHRHTLSYGELDRHSRQLASQLQAFGLVKGDTVGVMLPNVLAYPVIAAAVLRAGLTLVSFNPAYTSRELAHQLQDSAVKLLFTLQKLTAHLERLDPPSLVNLQAVVVCPAGKPTGSNRDKSEFLLNKLTGKTLLPRYALGSWLKPNSQPYHRPELTAYDLALIQYTGGTTGVAKGAVLTHGNLLANVRQVDALLQSAYPEPLSLSDIPLTDPTSQGDIVLVALPMYHVFSFTLGCLLTAYRGFTGLLIAHPQHIAGLVATLQRHPPQYLLGVNTLFGALLQQPSFAELDFSTLKATISGGMAVNPAVAKVWHTVTGLPLIEGYGLSETAPVATFNPLTVAEFTHKVGIPAPSTDIVLIDDHDQPVPIGERGEIAIKGPQVMQGYHNLPELNAHLFTDTGYLRTGDIGIMDERGFLKIVDRKKDLMVVSGFNVYPAEIEAVMLTHPDIAECVAIGIPSATRGEEPKLFVVRRNERLTEAQVIAFGKQHLMGYQRPRHVSFVDSLPKSLVGKPLRRALRQQEGLE